MGIEAGSHDVPDDASELRIAVAYATFNAHITSGLLDGALELLGEAGIEPTAVVPVAGAFELPLIAQRLAATNDGVVALGAVVEGDTDHYEHVAHRASEGLMRVALDTGVPVSFGVLTTTTATDAEVRSKPGPENKGREAALATVLAARTLRDL